MYSTCTILPEENEQVTDAFLTEHSDFCRDGFTLPAPVGETEGQLTLVAPALTVPTAFTFAA